MLTLLCAALAAPTLHEQALLADDPQDAERLLRAAVEQLPSGEARARAQLDLARVLGPTDEAFALIDPLLTGAEPASALRARADLLWASDQRASALAAWTKALEHDPTPEARERLAWRYLVGRDPTDPEAIDGSLQVRGIDRVAVQRGLRIGEEVVVLGSNAAIQIRTATVRWTPVKSLVQADVLARLPEDPQLTTRYLVGDAPWTGVERVADGAALVARLTSRPEVVAGAPPASTTPYTLGGLLLAGLLVLVVRLGGSSSR